MTRVFFLAAGRLRAYIVLNDKGGYMPVIKYEQIESNDVVMDGVRDVRKAVVISEKEGWSDHILRVFTIGPGGYTPRHAHDWEHINYIMKGRGKLRLGDEVHELKEKDFAVVPSNVEHQFENPYDTELEFICIVPNRGEY